MIDNVQEAVQRQGKQIADNHDKCIEIEQNIKNTVDWTEARAKKFVEATRDEIQQNIEHNKDIAEALDKALELVANRGIKKAKKSLESVVKRFPSTRAAKRARKLIGG